jgi:hypothetical protein
MSLLLISDNFRLITSETRNPTDDVKAMIALCFVFDFVDFNNQLFHVNHKRNFQFFAGDVRIYVAA